MVSSQLYSSSDKDPEWSVLLFSAEDLSMRKHKPGSRCGVQQVRLYWTHKSKWTEQYQETPWPGATSVTPKRLAKSIQWQIYRHYVSAELSGWNWFWLESAYCLMIHKRLANDWEDFRGIFRRIFWANWVHDFCVDSQILFSPQSALTIIWWPKRMANTCKLSSDSADCRVRADVTWIPCWRQGEGQHSEQSKSSLFQRHILTPTETGVFCVHYLEAAMRMRSTNEQIWLSKPLCLERRAACVPPIHTNTFFPWRQET